MRPTSHLLHTGEMHMAKIKTRRHARYSPPQGTVAALKPYGEEFGLIKDIGEGGLAFDRLVLNTQEESVPTEPKKEIHIFCPMNKIHLSGIRCKIVWENGVPVDPISLSSVSFMRVGVHFEELAHHEKDLLDIILEECEELREQALERT